MQYKILLPNIEKINIPLYIYSIMYTRKKSEKDVIKSTRFLSERSKRRAI